MKHLFIVMALIGLLMLAGCRFDANGLLGNDPVEKGEEAVTSRDAYRLCQSQNVSIQGVVNESSCATPSNLADILKQFDAGENNTVRIQFEKMWDGTFPKLQRIHYRTHRYYTSGADRPRELTCKIIESPATVRTYECKLEVPDITYIYGYQFAAMELGHDTCKASARYEAAFLYEMCETAGTDYSDIEVYFNRQRIPRLDAVLPSKP